MVGMAQYFDSRAEGWDKNTPTASPVQPAVLAMASVPAQGSVLDLGCGTGVMIPVYIEAGLSRIVGVDVSPKMIEVARQKFAENDNVEFIAADVLDLPKLEPFDAVIIYNAYPHFLDKQALVDKVASLLVPEGRFVVAHGTGKQVINGHHNSVPEEVTVGLRPAKEESKAWEGLFTIESVVDTPRFYAFSGQLKA